MSNISVKLSKQSKINEIFSKIDSISEPADLFFFINYSDCNTFKDEAANKGLRENIRVRLKPLCGYYKDDYDTWHVAIFIDAKKRRDHKRINLWYIYSKINKGVHIQHITPGQFTNASHESRARLEILKFDEISKDQRKSIVCFAKSKVGLDFDQSKWKHRNLPYIFGLPNIMHKQDQFSCQQLAIAAYGAAGINFPHPYKSFPVFNIGRYLGHPLGHPGGHCDPRHPYLMCHHIYRDPRFEMKAAVYQDPTTDEIILQTENLKKYSWNEALREAYIKRENLDP